MRGDEPARNVLLLNKYREQIWPVQGSVSDLLDRSGRFYRRGDRPGIIPLGTPFRCVHNALDVMSFSGLQYAEGFALGSGDHIIAHAWVVDSDGLAIEVTIPDEEPVAYFGIVLPNPRMGNARTPLGNLAYDVAHGLADMPPELSPGALDGRELGLVP